jgi:hypothetical protein
MQIMAVALDILLVIAAVAAYLARPRIGGELAKGLRTLTAGIVILGFAHLIETLIFAMFHVSTPFNEVVHRVLVGIAFIFVIAGFVRMRKAFKD